jgi:hypothetical protein
MVDIDWIRKADEGVDEGLDAFEKVTEKLRLPLKTVELTNITRETFRRTILYSCARMGMLHSGE